MGILFLAFGAWADSHPYNNIGATSKGNDSISLYGPPGDSFNSGPTALTLNSVAVLLAGSSDSNGTITMELLSSNSGPTPGSVLDDIGSITSPHSPSGVAVFVPSGTITLAADTTYWIELIASGGDATGWFWSLDTSGPGVAGQYYFGDGAVFPNSGGPYQMEVSGTTSPVPEPGILLMLGSGIGALFLKGRRKLLN
jgi:PEP-CTERM motif